MVRSGVLVVMSSSDVLPARFNIYFNIPVFMFPADVSLILGGGSEVLSEVLIFVFTTDVLSSLERRLVFVA